MDLQRIRLEVAQAQGTFGVLEIRATSDGSGVFAKAGLQTSVGNLYIIQINFANYPYQMPSVAVTQPAIRAGTPHRYTNGICYLHPSMWNPGQHNLTFVLGRAAKWLNKYEVWCAKGRWPGAQMAH